MISTAIENTDPTVVQSAPEIRAYVPKSDRRLVLAAIDNQLTVAKSAWKEKNADQNTNPAKEEFFMKCLDQTVASLKQQLEAITIPADEEDVEQTLDSFQMRLLSIRPDEDDDCDGESISSDEEDEKEISFDDDDIVDEEVLERVKKCRDDVRQVAARVISTREAVCRKALNEAERDIVNVLEVHGFNNSGNEDEEGVNEQIGDANERDVLNPMHVALQTLTSSLQNVDSGLAEKINDLKNTIGVVDRYIEKNERLSQGDENVLSQTEKALLASEQVKKNVEPMVDEDNDAQMDPDKKLARLLAGVL
ncbi:hypothetical protein ACHAWT_004069 [Skeletonema menzelii]|eukprot:scaffold2086_cov149-Skeletonema_menzelii.AAC.23